MSSADFLHDEDAPIELAKPLPLAPLKASFRDFRLHHARIRPGRDGEDGSMQDWEALYKSVGEARLKAMYAALPGPIFYNQALVWVEEESGRKTTAKAPAVDWRPRLLAFLRTPKPSPEQARAIAHLRVMAKERGLYSLDLTKAMKGERVVLPEITNETIAASLGKDEALIQRLRKAGFL